MRIDRLSRYRVTLIVLLPLLATATASADTVRVTADRVLVWTQPIGVSFVVTQLPRNTVVEVLRRVDEWYEIILPAGSTGVARTGFIRVAQVTLEATAPLSPLAASLLPATPPRPPRRSSTVITLDLVRRVGPEDLTRSSAAFTATYAEEGRITANYGPGTGWAGEMLVGQTFWGPIGAGLGGGYYFREQPARVDAQVPHPFYFNQPRSASFDTPGLTGYETAFHIPIMWMPAARTRVRVMVFGGLSIIHVSQTVVTDLTLDDPYPHDTVTIRRAITEKRSGTAPGFHAGTDVSFYFGPTVGIGVGARYSRASVEFDDDAGASVTGVAGAAQVLAGLRFRF